MRPTAVTILALLVTMPIAAWGTEFYVAPNGSDENPGSVDKPFRTLNHGVKPLKPGETLVARAGVYRESLIYNIPPGTSWEAPVTLKAYPGEKVILRPDAGPARVIEFSEFDKKPHQYIVIDGLVLDA